MNRQGSNSNPRGGIEWTHILGDLTGFTANPVRGCDHDCKWQMPDGSIVGCYAKFQKERLDGAGTFERVTWHPEVLEKIRARREPAGIFIDSMSDLFGQRVKTEWINEVVQCVRDCPHHVFFALTKNPSRFREFAVWNQRVVSNPHPQYWPANFIVGVSAPPTFMYGKRLTLAQQASWFKKALEWLCHESPAVLRWVSIEPLSFDVSEILEPYADEIHWAVIGAASIGSKYHQPERAHLDAAQRVLKCPVFMKGNLDRSLVARWRVEFPELKK